MKKPTNKDRSKMSVWLNAKERLDALAVAKRHGKGTIAYGLRRAVQESQERQVSGDEDG